MNRMIEFNISEIIPDRASLLKAQGVREGRPLPERIGGLLDKALEMAIAAAQPAGMISELTVSEFGPIFRGEGRNEPDTPFERIYPKADRLALFAVTIGMEISNAIERLFAKNDFALGAMLDSAASLAADNAVRSMEIRFHDEIAREKGMIKAEGKTVQTASADLHVLSYSPGYCGWHISGQKKLFGHLQPGQIGISLNESCLMIPLKSVTGVLIAGPRNIHLFENRYPFCRLCKSPTCLERRKEILGR